MTVDMQAEHSKQDYLICTVVRAIFSRQSQAINKRSQNKEHYSYSKPKVSSNL